MEKLAKLNSQGLLQMHEKYLQMSDALDESIEAQKRLVWRINSLERKLEESLRKNGTSGGASSPMFARIAAGLLFAVTTSAMFGVMLV